MFVFFILIIKLEFFGQIFPWYMISYNSNESKFYKYSLVSYDAHTIQYKSWTNYDLVCPWILLKLIKLQHTNKVILTISTWASTFSKAWDEENEPELMNCNTCLFII